MTSANVIETVLTILDETYPTIPMHEVHGKDPFRLLVAVILSQRSRDSVTVPVTAKLFEKITTVEDLDRMPQGELETYIHSISFPHSKAISLKAMARELLTRFDGKVPSTESELLSLPRVGRKTANIILTTFFDTPQIAVDTHVHRITNRLGWVKTKKPEETELALTKLIPPQWHSIVNRVFVVHGQTVCHPRNPDCAHCPIEKYCKKVGVNTRG